MSGTLRVLIADDELLARRRLLRLLAALPLVEVVGECVDGDAVLQRLAQGGVDAVDVVLLDIHMPRLSGVEAMALWPPRGPEIVFTTAHAQHAVAAFEGGVADYLLKPVEAGRLKVALDRVAARRSAVSAAPARLAVPTRSGMVLLAPEEICVVRIEGASVVLETDRGRFFSERSIAELHQRLGSAFLRSHRQALVQLARVERLEDTPSGGYLAHTDLGVAVPVSRQVARALRRRWTAGG